MSDWRPEHHGEGNYRCRWLAQAFDIAVLGFALGAAGCIVWLVFR